MAEAGLVFRADEQLAALQHLLHHYARSPLYPHHAVEFEGEMLGGAYVEGHSAHVALMHRAYHLGHDGVAHLLGEGRKLGLVVAHFLGHHRYAGALEQLMHVPGGYVSVAVDALDDLPYARHIDAEQLYFGRGGLRGLHHLGEGCGERDLVAEVDMPLLQELGHLWAGRVEARQYGEDGLLALQDFLVQHVVSLVKLHEAGRAEDDEDGVDALEAVLAVVDGQGEMLGRAGGEDVDGV